MWTRRISSKTVNICRIYSSLEEVFEFCWSSLAGEHSTLPKSTRRLIKLDKFIFGTPWLPYLLCKHWLASSVWNFCRWVADVPPLKTSPATKSEEKRVFLQAIIIWAYLSCSFFLVGPMTTKSDLCHFLHWPRLFCQHSSILASLILFAFLSTFSSFHSINCKKGQ